MASKTYVTLYLYIFCYLSGLYLTSLNSLQYYLQTTCFSKEIFFDLDVQVTRLQFQSFTNAISTNGHLPVFPRDASHILVAVVICLLSACWSLQNAVMEGANYRPRADWHALNIITTWIGDYIQRFTWNVITYPYLNHNDGWTKPP